MIELLEGRANVRGALESLRNIRAGAVEPNRVIAAPADSLLIEGWALQADDPAESTFVLVDGQPLARMVGRVERPDLFPPLGSGPGSGGYRGLVSLWLVSPGEHDLVIAAGSAAAGFAEIARRRLLVTNPALRVASAGLHFHPVGWTGQARLGEPVRLRGHVDGNGAQYDDVAAIVAERHVIHAELTEHAAGQQFELVLNSEQFGLDTVSVRLSAFIGAQRHDASNDVDLQLSMALES